MRSPSQILLHGALLGDVVESLTGKDVVIKRSPSRKIHAATGANMRCSHSSRAFCGKTLVGSAKVIWDGALDDYAKLLNIRMKEYLKANHAQPVNESYDSNNGVLSRNFTIESKAGLLCIHEKLFLKRLDSLFRKNKVDEISKGTRFLI